MPKALFVTNRQHISDAPGGVQTCSHEYLSLLKAAGLSIEVLLIDVDMRFTTRIRRALRTSPYTGSISPQDMVHLIQKGQSVDYIFFNQVNLASAISKFGSNIKSYGKVILLSHGAEVTDLLNLMRARQRLPLSGRLRPTPKMAICSVLADEIKSRQHVAASVCLSAFDANFERWLGVRHVMWIPRTVTAKPIPWHPVSNRFGYLGTLDHAPNLEGLVDVLRELKSVSTSLDIRVVGGPTRLGQWLAEHFPSVTYLGGLNDAQLAKEASTWTAFLNPIFCQARGCSTKLATALSWEIPVITTQIGERGYAYDRGSFATANDPNSFVELMYSLASSNSREGAWNALRTAAHSMPTMAENAKQLRAFLGLPDLSP